ncbi:hypothetical protein DPEC_G00264440 [Dallia pectoralis]|uniref:Uncharacterized protein n=1 Tax=Dallia pectoralis TaxID=75939 RepID=A0ACC2FS98_DALPE|nr:hypothetical protein DPEC_G00264440 [Dallia pectoralis]
MADQSNIQSAASKSIRPFKSSEEYLYAMKEDLADWLNTLYDLDVTADAFMEGLETGCALCRHANHVNRAALDFQLGYPEAASSLRMPAKDVVFQARNVVPGSFLARDNVSNFISWCRQELWIKDVLMFETNDIVEKCNEKNFVLCLLEVARRGAKFGMLAPMLIQLEEEIEEEIRDQENQGVPGPSRLPISRPLVRKESVVDEPEPDPYAHWQQKQRVLCDMRNLDELVREILGRCSCPAQFPMTKVSEGKYKVGDSSALIFIRVLRTHVMVRVGGGWDTLEHYLDKHDPCRCAAFAHRYHQAKASGQGAHSKSSSAHSSRSTSPGPHWRNEGIAPYKAPDRRPQGLEPPCVPSSSNRPGRSHHPSLPTDQHPNAGRAPLLPRPPRDRSEPRHFNPLRSKDSPSLPGTRRLSGDSDSSTASSKGGGGGAGGGRISLGSTRPSGEEVVLLVNRKEGRHVIERSVEAGGQLPALQPPMPRGRSHSREHRGPASILKPSPPQCPSDGSRASRGDRGLSLGPEGPHRLRGPRSHSQGKIPCRSRTSDASPGPSHRHGASQPPSSDRREDLRAKQLPPSSPRNTGGFSRRQSSSCSNSPIKGPQCGSPSKKTVVAPRPPVPCSPSVGKSRLLPPVSQVGRRSPRSSSPRSAHHHGHGPRTPRTSHGPRSNGHKGRPQERQEPEEPEGFGYPFQMLPSLDPQKEQDLYRSFEAEFLANTEQARVSPSRATGGGPLQLSPSSHPRSCTQTTSASADSNVTDSAYSSSNSSTSSINVTGKVGALPDLRESKRNCGVKDTLVPRLGYNPGRPSNSSHAEPEHWGGRGGGLRKLPAISSSMEEGELLPFLSGQRDSELTVSLSNPPSQLPVHPKGMNGRHVSGMERQHVHLNWDSEPDRDVPLEDHQPSFPYHLEEGEPNEDLPLPESCPSPIPLLASEDCSFQEDSSSESSSMCFSLSESRSESSPPPPPLANGDDDDKGVAPRTQRAGTKAGRVPSVYKLKSRIRPRTDNRPENSPSRIPTPVSYRDLKAGGGLNNLPAPTPPQSPHNSHTNGHPASRKVLHQAFRELIHTESRSPAMGSRERAYSVESGSGPDTEAWM